MWAEMGGIGRGKWEERFLSRVHKSDSCWLWRGGEFVSGYGAVQWKRKHLSAHRVAWQLKFGLIPPGLSVLHACDTPACVNPEHLSLGTQGANNADMVSRGRARGNARLDPLLVRQIRSASGTQDQIAQQFGISQSLVSKIVHRRLWKWVL